MKRWINETEAQAALLRRDAGRNVKLGFPALPKNVYLLEDTNGCSIRLCMSMSVERKEERFAIGPNDAAQYTYKEILEEHDSTLHHRGSQ